MSDCFYFACYQCRVRAWVGQSVIGDIDTFYIYREPDAATVFLRQHVEHSIRLVSDHFPSDWEWESYQRLDSDSATLEPKPSGEA